MGKCISDNIVAIRASLPDGVKLVAVSKYRPVEELRAAYDAGQRVFAENRPLELAEKARLLPDDIEWHYIGHLQTNKLKSVLPYVSLVQSVDSRHLMEAIQKWSETNGKNVNILLEIHIAKEESKQGFDENEALSIMADASKWPGISICGLMGMASHTNDTVLISNDFARLKALFDRIRRNWPNLDGFKELSMGMSEDYPVALRHGATIVRIGSAIFNPE